MVVLAELLGLGASVVPPLVGGRQWWLIYSWPNDAWDTYSPGWWIMLSAGEVNAKARRLLTQCQAWICYLAFGCAYSALFVLGVSTESNIILALFWPVNAFMLGMLVRFPLLARLPGWIACLAGFIAAILIIGYGLVDGAKLAACNFGVVAVGYIVLSRFSRVDQRLERPISVLYLFAAMLAASVYAGIANSLLGGPVFGAQEPATAFRYWFSVEILNQVAILPMILAFPEDRQWSRHLPLILHEQAPIVVLVVSAAAGVLFGGLAALAFPVPALFLCAISYRVFLTALLTFAYCAWTIVATTLGYIGLPTDNQLLVLSISMGRALVTLGPLIISTTTATRNEVLDQLRCLAAEREIVSNELEHRIKNVFALFNGLISLSVRDNPDSGPFADTLRNRLVALQHAHSLILAGSATPGGIGGLTSLKKVISVLLRPYEGGAERQSIVDGDDAFIDSGIVTLMALVFHELATNSIKHGALSDPRGVLEVHVRHSIDQLRIKWTEKAPRPNSQLGVSDTGFGSKLLDLTIKSQLRGFYTRTWAAGQMDIDIVLPGKLFHALKSTCGSEQ
ncbi:HWE histidine kinase domain-containing protein [Pseudaminobacter soli (ex Li et al. 2025)]|uniref:histidine kinase n=1 Tax=Pseudaminobacter soli (ex Li et al. 2025) TaxID=1295366 RepID=A0A2P7RVZ8_9HYPH|nr:HWE histidine kinase domain-containing protein [Mesorhizobium soli]PSJ54371.1 histidine kinase [Mesorhizobium soli]